MKGDKFEPIMFAVAESELHRFRKIETENTLLKVQIEGLEKENEQLKQEKAEYIKMLKDWEKLVCVNLSEGCCPSCEVCLFGELKEKTEGIERAKNESRI